MEQNYQNGESPLQPLQTTQQNDFSNQTSPQSDIKIPTHPTGKKYSKFFVVILAVLLVVTIITAGIFAMQNKTVSEKSVTNISDCQKTSDAGSCILSFALKQADPSICGEYFVGEKKDMCLSQVSVLKKDLATCQLVDTLQYRQICYQQITGKNLTATTSVTQNPSDCTSLTNPAEQYYCVAKQAESKNNPALCDTVTTQNFKDRCYMQVAEDTKNSQLCAKVRTPDNKDICYNALAQLTNDSKLCNQIKNNTGMKEGCLQIFELKKPQVPSLAVTMDLSMATLTGKAGQTVDVTGTIENYSGQTVYLNTMGGSLGSPDMELDTAYFFQVVPRIFKQGDIYKGTLFSVSIGSNVQPGNYRVSFYFMGGKDISGFDQLTKQNLSITVQ